MELDNKFDEINLIIDHFDELDNARMMSGVYTN